MRYHIVIRYSFDRNWLKLDRDERHKNEEIFQRDIVGPYADRLSVQHCDAEAFAAAYTDFLLITTDDLTAYYYFIETLRDSAFVTEGWLEIFDITIGIVDGYKEFENAQR